VPLSISTSYQCTTVSPHIIFLLLTLFCCPVLFVVSLHPNLLPTIAISTVRCAHAMASEPAISDHVIPPESPKPATCQPQPLPTYTSFSSPHSAYFPNFPPLLSMDRTHPAYSQTALPTTDQAPSAKDTWITHITSADIKTQMDIGPCSTHVMLPLADCSEVWTDKEN